MREGPHLAGGILDRAAKLREDAAALEAFRQDPRCRILPVWRGRPLFRADGGRERLALVAPADPLLSGAPGDWVFLGLHDGAARFAADVSAAGDTTGATADPSPEIAPGFRAPDLRDRLAELDAAAGELAATARALLSWHRRNGFCAACGARTRMTAGGWQRQCDACGAVHFPRTDPVVIMLVERAGRLLVGRSHGWPEGMYSLLAGFVEPGEGVEAAVRREVAEEAGLRVGRVRYIASQAWPWPGSLMLGCRAEALNDEIRLDAEELEDARWIDRQELVRVLTGRHDGLRQPRHGAIAHFLLSNWLADRLG